MKRVPADAPRCRVTRSRLADDAACLVRLAVYRSLLPHVQFFSRARWNADDLGRAAAKLVVALLAPTGQPVTVAIDDTLFRRRGKNGWAAGWFHDGSAPGSATTGYGNNWVIAAIVVKLPMVKRPVALHVLAKLVIKGTNSASRLWLAGELSRRFS